MSSKKYATDPKKRFSNRVENYNKYRPSYPLEIINFLKEENILAKNTIIADIGSGTGILTKIFLDNGNQVYGIEPNKDMREAAEKILHGYINFTSLEGSAESTGLEEYSIELIVAGQAFHWFDVERTKREFKRILKPNGNVALIWNNRGKAGTDFNNSYENFILKYGIDVREVRKNEGNVDLFFNYQKETFYNFQELDFTSFKGRVLSSSYIPLADTPIFPKMILELEDLFNKHQRNGIIRIEYDTEIYLGKLE
ncbi:MAG TPA: class I SAM-dependent methyltransferase [Candidatus Nanopelagicaceae bacterium]|nr:class I SAM-dependent methyltransferase [Candidatus Nanopelagicaceae bacterium]